MEGVLIYFICGNGDRIYAIKEHFGDWQTAFSKACSTDGDITYHDLMETRRKLTDCKAVVAFINEAFNYRSQLQYELAIAILLQKDIAIFTDGTILSNVFEYDFTCIIDIGKHSNWIETVKANIIGMRPRERSKDAVSSQMDKMLQCIWREEERSINDLIEEMQMESTQMEIAMNKRDAKDKVSHSFLCSLLTQSQENINSKVNQIPRDIKELCQKYQKMITKCHIRQIGRQLDLDDHHLDAVDTFYEHGIPEMFWQLVKKWYESYPDRVSVRKLRKALRSCNINTEGLSESRKKELLLFMWNIEQILIADVKSKDENTSEMMRQSGSDRVSHTFLCSLLTKSEENIAENIDQMPEEIKELCRRYQKMITKGHIRQIGRRLDLDNHHLDEVDGYFESGIPEMFWQLVKRWHAKYPNRVSARRLRKALQSCSIDTEETHMPKIHKDALHKMTQFLVDNIMDINIMMPLLISENILSDVTVAYVSAPSTLSQKIMRLLEVLTTKEHGLYMICDVFKKTDQGFIADRMIENLPELKEGRSKGSFPTVFTCPRSNSSSETSLKSFEKWMLINNKEVPIRGNGKVISNSAPAPALIETPRESDEHFYNNNYNAK